MSYFTNEISETNPYGYEVYKLADGTELMYSREDRVLFHRVTPTSMPLTIDPDSILDDVLASLRAADRDIREHRDMYTLMADPIINLLQDELQGANNALEQLQGNVPIPQNRKLGRLRKKSTIAL